MISRIEIVPMRPGMSWRCHKLDDEKLDKSLHYHHEFEIALHINVSGELLVGQQQETIDSFSLYLLPPMVSHAYHSENNQHSGKSTRYFIWFSPDWIANMTYSCAEFRKINDWLRGAKYGLQFNKETARKAQYLLQKLDCDKPKLNQLALFIELLSLLCVDKNASTLLSSTSFPFTVEKQPKNKVNKLAQYLEQNFSSVITLHNVADHMCMSSSSVHRLFLQHFGETFNQRLQKIRLSYAAQWLTESDDSIASICQRSGYQNQSNFNRLFKQYKGMTPNAYRKKFSAR